MFKRHSFNVKVVKDPNNDDQTIDPMEGPRVAQAYADVITNTVWEIAGPIVFVITIKSCFDLAKIAAKRMFR
jgi:hypothetical protein